MKLYLSSLGIPDEAAYTALFSGESNTIGVIPNAWMTYKSEASLPYIEALVKQLRALSFIPKQLNLLDYEGKPDELKKELKTLQGVWVTGGNTFYLNFVMVQSGFTTIIEELCNDGLVYGGESAGAVVAGATLRGIEHLDKPDDAPKQFWDGLHLVEYAIVPHWGNPKYAQKLDACKQEMSRFADVKLLDDSHILW